MSPGRGRARPRGAGHCRTRRTGSIPTTTWARRMTARTVTGERARGCPGTGRPPRRNHAAAWPPGQAPHGCHRDRPVRAGRGVSHPGSRPPHRPRSRTGRPVQARGVAPAAGRAVQAEAAELDLGDPQDPAARGRVETPRQRVGQEPRAHRGHAPLGDSQRGRPRPGGRARCPGADGPPGCAAPRVPWNTPDPRDRGRVRARPARSRRRRPAPARPQGGRGRGAPGGAARPTPPRTAPVGVGVGNGSAAGGPPDPDMHPGAAAPLPRPRSRHMLDQGGRRPARPAVQARRSLRTNRRTIRPRAAGRRTTRIINTRSPPPRRDCVAVAR